MSANRGGGKGEENHKGEAGAIHEIKRPTGPRYSFFQQVVKIPYLTTRELSIESTVNDLLLGMAIPLLLVVLEGGCETLGTEVFEVVDTVGEN